MMFRRASILALVGFVAFIAVAVAWLDGSPSITSAYTDPVLGVIDAPLNSASDSKPTRNVPGDAQGKRIGSAYTDPILGVIDAPSNSASDSQPTMDTPSLTPLAAPVINIDFEGLPFSTNVSGAPGNPASVLTSQFQNVGVLFGKAGVSAGVAVLQRSSLVPSSGVNVVLGLDAAGTMPGIATGDIFFSFVEPGTNTASTTDSVSFTIGDAGGDLDQFQIRSYDLSNELIDTQNVSNYSRFPVSINVPNIHRVEVDFLGTYGYGLDDLTFNQPGEKDTTIVNTGLTIDIKPGSEPNSINCDNAKGVIPVAILTTDGFDATTVDHTTVTFVGASETHLAKKTGEPRRHEEDVDGDGDNDLVFHFRFGETGLTCDSSEAALLGEIYDALAIEGIDAVSMTAGGSGG